MRGRLAPSGTAPIRANPRRDEVPPPPAPRPLPGSDDVTSTTIATLSVGIHDGASRNKLSSLGATVMSGITCPAASWLRDGTIRPLWPAPSIGSVLFRLT